MTQLDLWSAGGPSNSTLTNVESGVGQPSPSTLRKLDAGLRWRPGSARRVLEGGEPTPIDEVVLAPTALASISDVALLAEVGRRLGLKIEERDSGGDTAATKAAERASADRTMLKPARGTRARRAPQTESDRQPTVDPQPQARP